MSLKAHPDPQHPAGGYGFLELPGGTLSDESASVAIQNAYSERWLHPAETDTDNEVWRPQRHVFEAYEVHRHDGADWVHIGPEIINLVNEYTPLRVEINGQAYGITWPDTLLPGAAPAAPGRLTATARPVAITAPVPPVMSDPAPVKPDPGPKTDEPVASGNKSWVLLLILLLAAAGVAAYFWLNRDGAGPVSSGETDACSAEVVLALDGYATQIAAVRECGRGALPDTALKVIENASAADNSEALLLFGTLYDDNHLDARIENLVGLTFTDNPATAAEYYSRAARAGSQEAADRLATLCNELAGSKLTLDRSAFDDFCG